MPPVQSWRDVFNSRDAMRNFMRASLIPGQGTSISANKVISNMRAVGLGYNRSQMLADVRFSRGLDKYQTALTNADPNQIVPKAWMQEVPYALSQKVQYRFKLTVFDDETGEMQTMTRARATNNWYTKSEAEEEIVQDMMGVLQQYGLRLLGATLTEVWVAPGKNISR